MILEVLQSIANSVCWVCTLMCKDFMRLLRPQRNSPSEPC